MSESLTRLRAAIWAYIEDRAVLPTIDPYLEVSRASLDAALAAVEQEMAELRKDCDVWEEAAEALEAERDELRKRPTWEEAISTMGCVMVAMFGAKYWGPFDPSKTIADVSVELRENLIRNAAP